MSSWDFVPVAGGSADDSSPSAMRSRRHYTSLSKRVVPAFVLKRQFIESEGF